VRTAATKSYATDKDGKRANMAFNAQTLEKLDNAEREKIERAALC